MPLEQKSTHFRWVVITLLFTITTFNYIDRASISYAMHDIAREFHINDLRMGLILGAFGVGYMFSTLLGGIATDHYGPKITLLLSVLGWSLSLLFLGLSGNFLMVFAFRVLLGLAEGPNFPVVSRVVGDWLPCQERARALSFSLVAVPLALAIGGPLVSQLIVHFGWKGMFFVLAGSALLWLPFWWVYFTNFPEQSRHVNRDELKHIREGKESTISFNEASVRHHRRNVKQLWRFLLSQPTMLANYWSFFVFGYYLFFFMNWLPIYFETKYHLKLSAIGLFSILPWVLAALLLWLVGYFSDKILLKTRSYRLARSYPIWISQLLSAVCVIPVIMTNHFYWAIIFISLAIAFGMSANTAFYATNIDIASDRAGTALGVMTVLFALSGFVAPALTGLIIGITGRFDAAFMLLALLALSSVIVVFAFHRPDAARRLS